jgi:hypothetical protein
MDNSLLSSRAATLQSIRISSGVAILMAGNGVVQEIFSTAGEYVKVFLQSDRITARVIRSP